MTAKRDTVIRSSMAGWVNGASGMRVRSLKRNMRFLDQEDTFRIANEKFDQVLEGACMCCLNNACDMCFLQKLQKLSCNSNEVCDISSTARISGANKTISSPMRLTIGYRATFQISNVSRRLS